ncbi:MAG: hypothetical protein CVU38_09140 [Chloroflexi bacterium HGW-Chloroflexi-1]|nr:MAG: hypothetical protein CVU38_09140 [Chloroflexi bacterium HGW-Chloroflexi-1]
MSLTSRRLLWALRLLALALIGLHLAAPRFSEATAWGLWPATYLPAGWRWGLGLAAAALALLGGRIGRPRRDRPYSPMRFNTPGLRWGVALLASIPFYLFRIRHVRWGDANILVKAIPHPDVKLTYVWQAPLDVFVHAKAWALGNRLFGWPDPTPVYWISSALAGVVFVWILLGLASWLGRDRGERALLFGLVATLGTMQLFFGYIENYSIMTVGVLLYIWLALRAMRGQTSIVWPAAVLALTHAFHPSTIILAPSLLYLAVRMARAEQNRPPVPPTLGGDCAIFPKAHPESIEGLGTRGPGIRIHPRSGASIGRALVSIAVPYALVFVGVLALMSAGRHGVDALLGVDFPGGGDRRWFVPLFETTTRWEHYTMFSLGHLVDIVNEQLLVAPMIWPGLIATAIFAWRRLPRRDPEFRLLALLAALYWLLTLTWNPDYGGQRDWDLFAPAAAPAALLLGYMLPRALPERVPFRAAGWALIATQAFHAVAWIYQNTLPWSKP